MLTKNGDRNKDVKSENNAPLNLRITKLGIVSRDYQHKFVNGFRDFSHALPGILKLLDNEGCDAVLFSLYSIVPRKSYKPSAVFQGLELKNVKAVFLEEYQDEKSQDEEPREAGRFVVHHKTKQGWKECEFTLKFGKVADMPKDFVQKDLPIRIMGNTCVLLCGESNGVRYSPKDKVVKDTFGLKAAIPKAANIVLNPIHDRMTRFEMKLKRKFLSENGRWVVSVWNKGKKDKNGNVRKEKEPAWTVYFNGVDVPTARIKHAISNIEIGILDLASKPKS